MSTSTGAVAPDTTPEPAHEGAHAHPSDLKYIKVAILLAVLTAFEVGVYYVDMDSSLLVAILLPLMVFKFYMVAAYFMHLKQDTPLFTKMFVAGLSFAVVVYATMLFMFRLWE